MADAKSIRAIAQNALTPINPSDFTNFPLVGPIQVQINNYGILSHTGDGWSSVKNINMAYITAVKIEIFDNNDAVGIPVYQAQQDTYITSLNDNGIRAHFIYQAQNDPSSIDSSITAQFLLSFDIPVGKLVPSKTYYW